LGYFFINYITTLIDGRSYAVRDFLVLLSFHSNDRTFDTKYPMYCWRRWYELTNDKWRLHSILFVCKPSSTNEITFIPTPTILKKLHYIIDHNSICSRHRAYELS
jgi:hypothetical protein